MLDLVHAERPEQLVRELVEHLRTGMDGRARAGRPILEPATVVVQSLSLERWITQRVADELGVAANLRFLLPNRFLWETARAALGPDLPDGSPVAPDVLAWRLLGLFEDAAIAAGHPQLAGYLDGADALRRFRLAQRVADLFDQYLVFRPDWIATWEAGGLADLGPSEAWQAELWRRVVAGLGSDVQRRPVHRLRSLVDALRDVVDRPAGVVSDVALFGISSLPPLYLDLVIALARLADVTLLLLNPCSEHYWGDIELPRTLGDADLRTEQDLYLDAGNPLLASLARPVRDFVDLVVERAGDVLREPHWVPAGDRPEPDSLLAHVQNDVRNLVWRRPGGGSGREPVDVREDDRSLEVQVCHSPMREVEVLHDRLLRLFDADSPVPDLRPHEVAVLVPDIDLYAPYVDAVFGAGLASDGPDDAPRRIPYTIADRSAAAEHALLRAFVALLGLPESRFRSDEVLDLLALAPVRARAGVDGGQVAQVAEWLAEAGVRWGRDAAHRASLGLPACPEHSWRYGLESLLLGTMLPPELAGDDAPLFEGRMPHEGLEGADARALGRFAAWFETLCDLADGLAVLRTAAEWRTFVLGAFHALCDVREDDAADAADVLKDALGELERSAGEAALASRLDAATVRAWLETYLGGAARGGGFLAGAVTFGRLVPMRSIPFRVLCVLGLDDASFPRSAPELGFDLMARHPRRGDQSRRSDDRYLFLEILLAARERLVLSYVGRDVRDDSVRPPSVLLAELLDVVADGFRLASTPDDASRAETRAALRAHVVVEHPLQPFGETYFEDARSERLFSYAADQAAACAAVLEGAGGLAPLFPDGVPLPEPEPELLTIGVDDLVAFLANPAKFLCERRLRVVMPREDGGAPTDEPFELEWEQQFAVRETIARALDAGLERDVATTLLRERGLLPHGAPGDALGATEWDAMVRQRAGREARGEVVVDDLAVDVSAHGVRLTDRMPALRRGGLVIECGRKPYDRDRLRLWILHLLLCRERPDGVEAASVALGLEESLELPAVEEVEALLDTLLAAYREGLQRPLPFLVKPARAFAEKIAAGKPDAADKARSAARDAWRPDYPGRGTPPCDDPYWGLVLRGVDDEAVLGEEFEHWACLIEVPLECAAAGKPVPATPFIAGTAEIGAGR